MLRLVRIEPLFQPLPAIRIVMLQRGDFAACVVTRCGNRVSNMKAMVPVSLTGLNSLLLA